MNGHRVRKHSGIIGGGEVLQMYDTKTAVGGNRLDFVPVGKHLSNGCLLRRYKGASGSGEVLQVHDAQAAVGLGCLAAVPMG